jgi:hypothetical protein
MTSQTTLPYSVIAAVLTEVAVNFDTKSFRDGEPVVHFSIGHPQVGLIDMASFHSFATGLRGSKAPRPLQTKVLRNNVPFPEPGSHLPGPLFRANPGKTGCLSD